MSAERGTYGCRTEDLRMMQGNLHAWSSMHTRISTWYSLFNTVHVHIFCMHCLSVKPLLFTIQIAHLSKNLAEAFCVHNFTSTSRSIYPPTCLPHLCQYGLSGVSNTID